MDQPKMFFFKKLFKYFIVKLRDVSYVNNKSLRYVCK